MGVLGRRFVYVKLCWFDNNTGYPAAILGEFGHSLPFNINLEMHLPFEWAFSKMKEVRSMVQLQRLSILVKPSPVGLSAANQSGFVGPPDSVVAAASDWLQAHMSADNGQSVIVAGPPEDRWLFRAADEEGTDNSGRKRAYIAFGALPPDLDPVTLTRLLFGAFRTRKPSKEDGNTCTIELAPESAANNQLVVSALVSLATGATRLQSWTTMRLQLG